MFTRGKQTEAQTIRSLFRKHTEMLSRKDNIHDISNNAHVCDKKIKMESMGLFRGRI